ncbi:hypothetical protein NFI96_011997, partial [Prochilodus magdalenae]
MDGSDSHLVYHTIPEGSQPSLYLLYKELAGMRKKNGINKS